jgi:hypothetical protein
MNLYSTLLSVTLGCLSLTSFSQFLKSGIVIHRTTMFWNNKDGTKTIEPYDNKIWFRDSTVVYEVRLNLETDDSTPEGRIIKKSRPVWMYSFIDLRTMIGQDYLHFNDSSRSFSNYRLKENESPGWQFNKVIPLSKPNLIDRNLRDTQINGVKVKRVKVLNQHYPLIMEYVIYYLKIDTSKHMFHMDQAIRGIYPGYRAFQVDSFDDTGSLWSRSELTIIAEHLSKEEKSVFSHWEKNAKTTKLPLLSSHLEALTSTEIPHPPHENPTIKLVPHSHEN